MSTEIATVEPRRADLEHRREMELSRDQVELLKRTVCSGSTDDEFALFMATARRLGLDPFTHQVHAVKRWDSREKREVMAIQVGIDGLRLGAERTGEYLPGPKPEFIFDAKGKLISATAYVRKFRHGEWHVIEAEVFWDEYVQRKNSGEITRMWAEKPRVMLGKTAEAMALRKAFPLELSGVYADEEMPSIEDDAPVVTTAPPPRPTTVQGAPVRAALPPPQTQRAPAPLPPKCQTAPAPRPAPAGDPPRAAAPPAAPPNPPSAAAASPPGDATSAPTAPATPAPRPLDFMAQERAEQAAAPPPAPAAPPERVPGEDDDGPVDAAAQADEFRMCVLIDECQDHTQLRATAVKIKLFPETPRLRLKERYSKRWRELETGGQR